MPSSASEEESPAAEGATTCTFTDCFWSATASRSRNEPGASPYPLGNECVRNRTFTLLWLLQRVAPLRQFFQTSSKLAYLRALRRDELSDQSRRKQHAAEDETRLDQIEQRTEALSREYSPEHS